jgi:hypothetical protein
MRHFIACMSGYWISQSYIGISSFEALNYHLRFSLIFCIILAILISALIGELNE